MTEALNYIILTVNTDNGTTITVDQNLDNLTLAFPFRLVSSSPFEILTATSKASTYVLNVTRNEEGTSQQSLGGATVVCELTHETLEEIYDEALTLEKIIGDNYALTGDVSSPSAPQIIVETTNNIVYIYNGTSWVELNPTSHVDYADLLTSTAHTQYYTESRADTWHSNLTKLHLNPVDHDHLTNPAANIRNLSSQPSDTVDGGVYLLDGSKTLYYHDGVEWKQYDTVPQYMMVYRDDGVCPEGWSEKTTWNGKYLKGAGTGVWTGSSGGASTHSHGLTEIPAHAHTITSRNITINSDSDHSHSVPGSTSSGGGAGKTTDKHQQQGTGSAGAHTHTVTVPAHSTNNAGSSTATTETSTSEPNHVNLTLCEKN